jgi:glyoxylase-like metal-dependent hydrolase (beta-lactamase superfamily II)
MSDAPRTNTATVDVLTAGYYGRGVASTVGLIRDGGAIVVVDPGMVRERSLILAPLAALGIHPEEVTDVVFSHHHPDHTINAALFGRARIHDFWAIYADDVWTDRRVVNHPDGWSLSPSVRLLATPGHSDQDISTLVETSDGLVVCTHVWWTEQGPATDPRGASQHELHQSRAKVLALRPALVIPGHGAAFVPSGQTPD